MNYYRHLFTNSSNAGRVVNMNTLWRSPFDHSFLAYRAIINHTKSCKQLYLIQWLTLMKWSRKRNWELHNTCKILHWESHDCLESPGTLVEWRNDELTSDRVSGLKLDNNIRLLADVVIICQIPKFICRNKWKV